MRGGHAEGVVMDMPLTLRRWDGMGLPGRIQLKHVVPKIEESRAERVARACLKKLPKLDAWRRLHQARTVLVLEENDIQTTNAGLVCDTYLETIRGRTDVHDETWLVSTAVDPWYAHPLLVGGRTYYDLAGEFRGAVGWQIDPATMTITRLP
jgi:hypothetical protein